MAEAALAMAFRAWQGSRVCVTTRLVFDESMVEGLVGSDAFSWVESQQLPNQIESINVTATTKTTGIVGDLAVPNGTETQPWNVRRVRVGDGSCKLLRSIRQ